MQRRAAAAYVAVFIVIAAGSYAVIGAAEEPAISLENPDVTVAAGENFTVDGVEYNAQNISEPEEEEGEGLEEGEGEDQPVQAVEATVTWTEDVNQTETLENGSVITVDGTNWSVEVPDEDDPSTFQLVENFTLDRPTVEQGNQTYVIVERDGEQVLVERGEYVDQEFGEPDTREFSEGDSFNETRQVDNVTAGEVTLAWTETEEQQTTIAEGDEVTLGETTFVAHFPDQETMMLTSDTEAYQAELDEQTQYQQRLTGISYVAAISLVAALLVLALAYLPRRR